MTSRATPSCSPATAGWAPRAARTTALHYVPLPGKQSDPGMGKDGVWPTNNLLDSANNLWESWIEKTQTRPHWWLVSVLQAESLGRDWSLKDSGRGNEAVRVMIRWWKSSFWAAPLLPWCLSKNTSFLPHLGIICLVVSVHVLLAGRPNINLCK